jgi:hypothetical protein
MAKVDLAILGDPQGHLHCLCSMLRYFATIGGRDPLGALRWPQWQMGRSWL